MLTVLPSYVSISMIASQLLTYILLIFNLNCYFEEKKSSPEFETHQSEAKLIQRERIATVGMSFYIILLPVVFLVQYFCIDTKLDESNFIVYDKSWLFYEYQLIPFAVITVGAVGVATFYVSKAMDKIFGKAVYPEKSVVNRTLIVMVLVVCWRAFGFLALSFGGLKAVFIYKN